MVTPYGFSSKACVSDSDYYKNIRIQAPTELNIRITAFRDAIPHGLADSCQCFRRKCCFHLQNIRFAALQMETVGFSETMFYQTAEHHIPHNLSMK
jgi:hypothetical protein